MKSISRMTILIWMDAYERRKKKYIYKILHLFDKE